MNNNTSIEKRESVKRDYDAIADACAEEFGKEYEDFDVISKFMSQLKPNSKILDLGGGTGKLTDLFIKNGYNAICYDFSTEMMRKSKEYFGELPYILDDMLNITKHFKQGSIDGIIAFYSLFHIPREDIVDLFMEINKTLNKMEFYALAYNWEMEKNL